MLGPEVLQDLSLVIRFSVVQRDDCAKICDGVYLQMRIVVTEDVFGGRVRCA
jgi:hypothetical protein